MAIVPTGIPAGICTIDSSESWPLSAFDCTGTPRRAARVFAAVMPGRCAAPPAPAMMTFRPRSAAVSAYSNSRSGVRCADTTRTSCATPSDSSVSLACRIVSQSERDPMMMPTATPVASSAHAGILTASSAAYRPAERHREVWFERIEHGTEQGLPGALFLSVAAIRDRGQHSCSRTSGAGRADRRSRTLSIAPSPFVRTSRSRQRSACLEVADCAALDTGFLRSVVRAPRMAELVSTFMSSLAMYCFWRRSASRDRIRPRCLDRRQRAVRRVRGSLNLVVASRPSSLLAERPSPPAPRVSCSLLLGFESVNG